MCRYVWKQGARYRPGYFLTHYLDSAVAIISFSFSAQPAAAQWGSEALRLLSTNNQTMKAKGSGSDWVSIVPLPNFALSCRGI